MPDATLIQRLRQRKLVQWALAYLSGAFVVFQAVEVLADPWAISASAQRFLHIVLVLGFFLTLVLAWYHGEKGRQRVSGPELVMIATLLLLGGGILSLVDVGAPARSGALVAGSASREDPRPSVAALPFANMSTAPEDAYLADGLHEEVLTHLARIGGLKVVSRTSVMSYRARSENVREVARELGVDAVLEGTVQKVRDEMRVSVQLIDPSSDGPLWVETYDREHSLDNLLAVQEEIATQIALALQAELSPEEKARLAERPTENLEAYQALLRGRYFLNLPHYTPDTQARALGEFERAVRLDPGFALAWAELADAHAQEVYYWTDASPERRALARQAAEKALACGEPTPEVALILGLLPLWLDRDAPRAMQEIDKAAEGLPNSREVRIARAHVYETEGRLPEARHELLEALDLSPRDPDLYTELAIVQWVLRDYRGTLEWVDRALDLTPDALWPNLFKVFANWSDHGPTGETAEILWSLPPDAGWVLWSRSWQDLLTHRFDDVLALLAEAGTDWIRTKMWARPRALVEAWAYVAMGREDEAARRFEDARRRLETEVTAHPDDPRYRSSLGLALAGLGEREAAVAAGEKAVALLPLSRDALYGIPYVWDLAAIHAAVGDQEAALAAMRTLLTEPTWVTPIWLQLDPRFDRVTASPAFAALRADYETEVVDRGH